MPKDGRIQSAIGLRDAEANEGEAMQTVDAVVIGMGPGGESVAGELAKAGLNVVGIESELVGGECPYWGCVPSKMMIRAANLLAEARRVPGLAGESTVAPDWAPVAKRIRDEATDDWNDQVAADRFTDAGGTLIRGRGRLVGPDTVEVNGEQFKARRAIVIAAGTSAAVPPVSGLAETPYWTNREAIATEEVPDSLIVMGGGAIGAELAQVFSRFGSRVTIIEGADTLLPLEDPAAGELLGEVFDNEGITVQTGAFASSVSFENDTFKVTVGDEVFTASKLLVATGRRPNLGPLGLEHAGVDTDARWIPVDDHLNVGGLVWAVGDVTGKGAFTHVAVYQARIAADAILGRETAPADYRAVPHVTFTDPEVGSVGLTADAAREAGLEVRTGKAQVPSTARGWLHKTGNEGFIEVVEDTATGTLVGATSVGPVGGEVLGALSVAVHAQVPVATLKSMIYAYPTFHRGIEDAVRDLDS